MARKALLGAQVKCLLSDVSDHCSRHLNEVETDLVQTSILLREAIEKLGASFMAIHEAVETQQQMVATLLENVGTDAELAEKLKAKHDEISVHVNAAVTGLQFQDMTNQLISRALQRVTGLRDVLASIESGESTLSDNSEAKELTAALYTINKTFEEQSLKLESALWKAVCQTHMESGDIELF